MGKTATNLTMILGLITLAYGGYYLYNKTIGGNTTFDTNEQTMQNMLKNTQVFIEYESVLNKIRLDLSLFEDPRLLSLRSYATPIRESTVGKNDPFAEVPRLRLNTEQQ